MEHTVEQVRVLYRGLVLGGAARLHRAGTAEDFLEGVAPMPVGTELELEGASGAMAVRVLAVAEEARGGRGPGMIVGSAADVSTDDTSTGDTSTGDTSTGDTSTGDTSTGDTSTGDTSTGDTSTTDTSTGGGPPAKSETGKRKRRRR